MGMYEALATAARLTEDSETEQLARQLQREEKEDHILAWRALPETARAASELVLSKMDK
jgi:hypothetical protein